MHHLRAVLDITQSGGHLAPTRIDSFQVVGSGRNTRGVRRVRCNALDISSRLVVSVCMTARKPLFCWRPTAPAHM